MIAVFDIGNSRIKWARFEPPAANALIELQDRGALAHDGSALPAAEWQAWPAPAAILVSSVAAEPVWRQLRDWCERHWQQTPQRLIAPARGCGLENAYAQPQTLGSDRWAAMVAARHLLPEAFCVIDCGTAVTLDFVDADGRHRGGYIVPGIRLMQQGLARGTAVPAMPEVSGAAPEPLAPGTSTRQCVEKGSIMAIAGLVEKACERQAFSCLLTGGDAAVLAAALEHPARVEPDLVLLGLAWIATMQGEPAAGRRKT